MLGLGYDVGSSSIKAALIDSETGRCVASGFQPRTEMAITALRAGWAEQDPRLWWQHLKAVTAQVLAAGQAAAGDIGAIGISYQMHGLVLVDSDHKLLRPAIIWCDSRAVEIGQRAFESLGSDRCLSRLFNSPGNFTASKLRWVCENEPAIFERAAAFMLPGDYIALQLTGEAATTLSGLSEGILWDFKADAPAGFLLDHFGIHRRLIPRLVPTFGEQGRVTQAAAAELGLAPGTPVTYRAGDQPNNALSLKVLEPGEIAATAGTSGVVYGVSGVTRFDPQSRVNTFAHVNHSGSQPRLGILLCINGTGCANGWLRRLFSLPYEAMNHAAESIPPGADGLVFLPFGNGAERMLGNRDLGARLFHLNFNLHSAAHLFRAVQEGVVHAFQYGMQIMSEVGVQPSVIRAGRSNMFLSPLFRQTLADLSGVTIELFNTDGAQGAARGALLGLGCYRFPAEAFTGLEQVGLVEPRRENRGACQEAYRRWLQQLELNINR